MHAGQFLKSPNKLSTGIDGTGISIHRVKGGKMRMGRIFASQLPLSNSAIFPRKAPSHGEILGWSSFRRMSEFHGLRSAIRQACPPLLPFTFQQVGIRCFEFLAFPGPEAKARRAKIMRRSSLPGPGGQAVLFPRSSSFPCRGDPPGRPMGPPRSAEARKDLSGELLSRRCFFRATPLPPGHKVVFAQERERQR